MFTSNIKILFSCKRISNNTKLSINIISNIGGLLMAKTDELMKNLFKHKEIFADLFNATIFNGQQLIKPEKLTEINTENIHIEDSIQDKDNINSNITKRYRDLCMRQNDSILQIILGCEDQSEVDYSMPIRTMLYDSLKYTEQQKNLELKSIIPNYKMNLLWAYNIKDIDKFKSDLQYILYMLKYKEEKENLKEYISENNDNLQKMNQDSHNVAVALLNHKLPELIEDDKKGEIRMGKNAIEAIHDDGIAEGDTLHRILLIMKKIQKGKTLATIADEIEEEEKDILPIYTMIKDHPNESKEEIYKLLQAN